MLVTLLAAARACRVLGGGNVEIGSQSGGSVGAESGSPRAVDVRSGLSHSPSVDSGSLTMIGGQEGDGSAGGPVLGKEIKNQKQAKTSKTSDK